MTKKFIMYWLLTFLVFSFGLFAQAGLTQTGSAIREKFFFKVYLITHAMKEVPAKNAQDIINAETDKKFTLKMLRGVESAKISGAFTEAFTKNGHSDKLQQLNTFSNVLTGDLAENDVITISYNAASKAVSCSYKGKTSTVNGSDFMKAVWSIWFGKIDPSSITQSLMSQIK
jgi:hypothetical protein